MTFCTLDASFKTVNRITGCDQALIRRLRATGASDFLAFSFPFFNSLPFLFLFNFCIQSSDLLGFYGIKVHKFIFRVSFV